MEFWINIAVSLLLAAAGWALYILTGNATKVAGTGTAMLGVGTQATITTLTNSTILELVAFVGFIGLLLVGLEKKAYSLPTSGAGVGALKVTAKQLETQHPFVTIQKNYIYTKPQEAVLG
jgi:hypothetical protein